MEISVDHVKLVFPLDLGVEGVKVIQPNDSLPQQRDTVADIKSIVADVKLLPLLRKKVEIDELTLKNAKFNTTNFIHEARVKGSFDELSLESHGIDLSGETMRLDKARLKNANIDVALSDTVPEDTTTTPTFWKIQADSLNIDNSNVTVHLPGDTLQAKARLGKFSANKGYFDLYKGIYKVGKADLTDGSLNYDNNFAEKVKGLDTNHLSLSDVNIGLDSLVYQSPKLDFSLRSCAFKEKSGIEVSDLHGPVSLDSAKVSLPSVHLKTTDSDIDASIDLDLNSFDDINPGKIKAKIDGQLGKQDIMLFMGDMPKDFVRQWPNRPLQVKGAVNGNMQNVDFAGLYVTLPTAFDILADGYVKNPTDIDKLEADVKLKARTQDVDFLKTLLDPSTAKQIRIPRGIALDGTVKAKNKQYSADFTASEGRGKIKGTGYYNTSDDSYQADLKVNNLNIHDFLPKDSLYTFSGDINLKGRGTDVMSKSTKIDATANVKNLRYGSWNLNNIKAKAHVSNGKAHADIDSDNEMLQGLVSVDALLDKKNIRATASADIRNADLYNLRLFDDKYSISMCTHIDFASDMDDFYRAEGTIDDIVLRDDSGHVVRPENIDLDIYTNKDTTNARVSCGNLYLDMDAGCGYKDILDSSTKLIDELAAEYKVKKFDQTKIRQCLPAMNLYLSSGKNNPVYGYAKYKGFEFDTLFVNMASSPVDGLNGDFKLHKLKNDAIQLDTISLFVRSDSTNTTFSAQIQNNKKNPDYVFNALMDGYFLENGAGVNALCYDSDNKLVLNMGARAMLEDGGVRVTLSPEKPVVGYKDFNLNSDNYIFIGDNNRVSAKVDLVADDGTGVKIYSNDDNLEALQDITISLNKFDLEKTLSVLPYLPHITGTLNGDFHGIQNDKEISVSSDVTVKDMTYERCPLGDLGAEFVYIPKDDDSHYIDGSLKQNEQEVATISGTYRSKGDGDLDAILSLNRFPLDMVNGFIPEQIIGLKGYGEGDLTVKGSLKKPDVNGEIYVDSSYLVSVPYGIEMRFDNDPVRVVNSKLLLENFGLYSHNSNPLNLYGNIDFSDMNRISMDIKMRAQNFLLIDAEETFRSITYGKAYVNFFGFLRGELDDLKMRGKMDVLGNTDMSYILKDSPLTTDNQLDDLVKFTDFTDSTTMVISRPEPTGLDMDLSISVNSGAHITCYLNSDHTNYVDLTGGGDLRLLYNAIDDVRLTGRYTLNEGKMKYSLPVIPLKTFTIQDGSYIEFTGDPFNPTLNITAEERTKATVSSDGGSDRSVAFDCGVKVTQTLENMGLEFIINAPEDVSISSELASMSKEQRGKLAVTMLTTGMYLADGNTSGFSMNSALNSFLQGEINNIAGNAMKSVDVSIGLENSTDVSGGTHTDYSFKFAKRFWNNRLNIIVGGKISTGSEAQSQNQNFFDNVTMEYRLNDTSNKYVKLFYEKEAYDWLEGNVTEFGGGFVWRRKLQHFSDIFKFKDNKDQMPPADSAKVRKETADSVRARSAAGDSVKVENNKE